MSVIDPHEYDEAELRSGTGEVIDRRCGTCGYHQRQCELKYKPRDLIDPHIFTPQLSRPDFCTVCLWPENKCVTMYGPKGPIDPHIFNPTLTTIAAAKGYEVHCVTCGLGERLCRLTYNPNSTVVSKSGTPTVSSGHMVEPVGQASGAYYNTGACEHFVGLSQWGMYPEPWRTCQDCGWPRAQHELPRCKGALIIKGEHFQCELKHPHPGMPCSSQAAEAVWGSHTMVEKSGQRMPGLPDGIPLIRTVVERPIDGKS